MKRTIDVRKGHNIIINRVIKNERYSDRSLFHLSEDLIEQSKALQNAMDKGWNTVAIRSKAIRVKNEIDSVKQIINEIKE